MTFIVAFFLMTLIALFINMKCVNAEKRILFYQQWVTKLEADMDRMRDLVVRLEHEVDESMRADYWAERYKELEKVCKKK